MTKVETIRRPRNVIERLLDAIEGVSAIREHIDGLAEGLIERRHISRALEEAKTAAGENDADRVVRAVRLLDAISAKHGVLEIEELPKFAWPTFIEPRTLGAAGHIGLALISDGYRMKGQDVSVNSEAGNYLVDQYMRDEDIVHVKLPPPQERRLVNLT